MSSDFQVKFELPILDIIAIFIAIVAVIVALYAIYISNEIRINTENTVNEIQLSRQELIKIQLLLIGD